MNGPKVKQFVESKDNSSDFLIIPNNIKLTFEECLWIIFGLHKLLENQNYYLWTPQIVLLHSVARKTESNSNQL